MNELPPQVQNQLAQLQQVQQQAQALVQQKGQVEMLLRETETALEELNKVEDDATVYKSAGELLIKAKKEDVLKDLEEKKDSLDVRLKSLARQEERIQARFQQLQEQIKQSLSKGSGKAE
ncbi:prefoldin subunit beta [Methanocella sp. CWC-04]|uniref:Prefoldin subunit beta n=1 Tax=Methanooceanicella nereidis TaxID=2052831 RepID=A0AAP2RH76_9EURY|nr:prefoldin subunit beta [Methanocella sp. CWC-04]MCD1296140.1 prefoldin subunit beta [Methanocella sp. CWC-04]